MANQPILRRPMAGRTFHDRQADETVYVECGDVTVTSHRVICGSSVYPIGGITKVEVEEEERGGKRFSLALLICGPLLLFAGLFLLRDWLPAIVLFVAAVVVAVLIYTLRRPAHSVFNVVIRTAGGHGEVMTTHDERTADVIAEAISAVLIRQRP